MGTIYKITNKINNKVYIGKTVRNPEDRWQEHLRHYKNIDYAIYLAMRKYGVENFSFEIIESNVKENELSNKEIEYIKYYDSYNNGYNETIGGEGFTKYSIEEMKQLWDKGYSLNEIQIKMGIKRSGLVSDRLINEGYITHQDIQNRLSEKAKKQNSDPVLQFTKNGEFIAEYETAAQAARTLNISSSSNIRACCRDKLKSAYGYVWKRKNEYGPQRQKAGG